MYALPPTGEFMPFGDGALPLEPTANATAEAYPLLRHHAHRFDDAGLRWWLTHVRDAGERDHYLDLLSEDEASVSAPDERPNARVFPDVGWAAMHSDMTRPETDTLVVFKSSPYGSSSHSHADQNGFCIFKGGTILTMPSGYYGPVVGAPHHAEWTSATRASNCVLVGGEGQPNGKADARGRIERFENHADLCYACGNATEAYEERLVLARRHLLFLRPGLLLLLDELEAPEPARFQWMLHSLSPMQVGSNRVVVERKGTRMEALLAASTGLTLNCTDEFGVPYNQGVPEAFHREVPDHWHLEAETERETGAARIAAVFGVSGPGEKVELETIDHPGWFGIRAYSPSGRSDGWLQLEPDTPGPPGYGLHVERGDARLCGRGVAGPNFCGAL
jgi:hypothetical protein